MRDFLPGPEQLFSRKHALRLGLPQDSAANASQIATVNKDDLDDLAGTIPKQLLDRVNEGLRWFLGLDP